MDFTQVDVELEGRLVLQGLNRSLHERRIAVIGLNGSGKSTLVRLINGLCLPSKGRVAVEGMDIKKSAKQIRRLVGFVFQNPQNQLVMPEVKEDLKFGLKNHGVKDELAQQIIGEVLHDLKAEKLLESNTYQLSGGEKQLVALAAVLVMKPRLVIFDEPATSLDLLNRNRLAHVLDRLPQQVITVSHDLELIRGYDRALLVHQGQIVADGAPGAVISEYLEMCQC